MLLDFFFSVIGQFSVFRIRHPSVVGCRKNPPRCSLHVIGGCLNIFIGSSAGILLFIEGQISGSDSEVAPCMGEVVLGSKFRLL